MALLMIRGGAAWRWATPAATAAENAVHGSAEKSSEPVRASCNGLASPVGSGASRTR